MMTLPQTIIFPFRIKDTFTKKRSQRTRITIVVIIIDYIYTYFDKIIYHGLRRKFILALNIRFLALFDILPIISPMPIDIPL